MPEPDVAPTAKQKPVSGLDPRESSASRADLAMAVGMALMLFVSYILPSIWLPIEETPEARVAVVAREMLRRDDWLVPHLGDQPRFTKPPLPYWLSAASAKMLGSDPTGRLVSEQANTLPSAALGALGVFMIVAFGCRVFGRAAGLWAGLILGLSPLYAIWAHHGTGEIPVTFFTAAALLCAAWLACAPRPGIFCALGLGLALGLGILCKGHIPVLVVTGALLVEAIRRRRFNAHKALLFVLAMATAFGIVVPWLTALHKHAPEAFTVMFDEIQSPAVSKGHVQEQWPFYYLYKLPGGLLPWTVLLLFAWPMSLSRAKGERARTRRDLTLADRIESFLLVAAIVGFVGFELVRKQQDYYLLPILPPLALSAGAALGRLAQPGGFFEEKIAWAHLLLGLPAALALALAPLIFESVGGRADLQPSWFMTVPLGVLGLIFVFVAARQWVDGNPGWAGLCLGIMVYSCMLSWFVMKSVGAQERNPLAREHLPIRTTLKTLGSNLRIYEVKVGASAPEMMYYLDCNAVFGLNELLAETVDEKGKPKPPVPGEPLRVVICPKALAEKLGVASSDSDLQVVPLEHGVTGALFLKARD